MIDKRLILNELINYYSEGKIGDFAKKLGVSQQTLSNWKSRNTFDPEIIFTNCENLSAEWLLTGNGPMTKNAESTIEDSHYKELYNDMKIQFTKIMGHLEQVNKDQKSVIEAQKALIDKLMTLNRD